MAKTENQKLEQSRKAKELREKRKKEKREDRTGERLLAWLDDVIRASGYNHKKFADAAGMTPQAVHWIFSVVDDCTLEKAETMLDAIGLTLKVKLAPTENGKPKPKTLKKAWNAGDVKMEISGNLGLIAPKANNYPYPEYIINYPQDGRLAWLVGYIKEQGLSISAFAAANGLPPLTVRYWIINDNIKISQIAELATKTGTKIIWEINTKS